MMGFLALFSIILGSLFLTSMTQAQTVYKDAVEITLLDWAVRMMSPDANIPAEWGIHFPQGSVLDFPFRFSPERTFLNITDMWTTIFAISHTVHQATTASFSITINDNVTITTPSQQFHQSCPTEVSVHIQDLNLYETTNQGLNILQLSNPSQDISINRITLFIEYEYQSGTQGVGGFYIPIDKITLVAPYLALLLTVILVASISVAIIKYKKQQ